MLKKSLYSNLRNYLLWILIICSLGMTSCRKQFVKDNHSVLISIEMTMLHDNSFQVFYLMRTDDSYTEENSVKFNIQGKSEPQNIHLELPKGIKPKNIRVDFRDHKNQNINLPLKKIKIQYKEEKIELFPEELVLYFHFNEHISIDTNNNISLDHSKDQFDPMMVGREALNKKLVKLYKPDIYDY